MLACYRGNSKYHYDGVRVKATSYLSQGEEQGDWELYGEETIGTQPCEEYIDDTRFLVTFLHFFYAKTALKLHA